MIYAFLTEDLDATGKEKLDDILASADNDRKAQARRERAVIARILNPRPE